MNMPKVNKCDVTQCCYNNNKTCHALAITVGDGTVPRCDTFTTTCKAKGGDAAAVGCVGACKVNICRHNKNLECTASGIMVGRGKQPADCLTFEAV